MNVQPSGLKRMVQTKSAKVPTQFSSLELYRALRVRVALKALMGGSHSTRCAHLLSFGIAGRRLGCVVIGACSEGILC